MTQPFVAPDFVQHLAGLVPSFAGEIRYTGPHRSAFAEALSARSHARVSAPNAGQNNFDCAVFYLSGDETATAGALHENLAALSQDGRALIVVLPQPGAMPIEELGTKLSTFGYTIHSHDEITASGEGAQLRGYIAKAAHRAYDPVRHARSLMLGKHPDWAFEILTQIPESMQQEPDTLAQIAANKILCTLAWDSKEGTNNRLARFFYSQVTFYQAVAAAPHAHEPYLCHAEFWKRVGDASMHARLLRSVSHVVPESVRQRADKPMPLDKPQRTVCIPPDWRPSVWMPRLLFITNLRPHYGLDVQYYGLCEVLGDENVVDFPHKPTLHGAKPEELAHYPCMFDRKGAPYSLRDIVQQLKGGAFDAVIYADVEQDVDEQAMHTICEAAGDTPIVLFDAQDDPLDQWQKMNAYIGGGLCMHFKREMLSCWDYGEHSVAMPFAYADQRVPRLERQARTTPLFWAGHREFALRRLYLEQIESKFGFDLRQSYKQEEYAAALCSARIGLNIFGFGYDTVRYWEIPAHGAMLFAERMPIDIPHNFIDGESAVFFDDLGDLEEKLAYYVEHPEESAAIAARGHEHFLKYHTASARARQMLGWMQSRLFEGEAKWKV